MIIIANKPGQLGNRLLVFAGFMALAMEKQITILNPSLDEYADFFETTKTDLFCRYPHRRSRIQPGKTLRRWLYQSAYYAARLLAKLGFTGGRIKVIKLDWEEELRLDDAAFLETIERRQLLFVQGWLFRNESMVIKNAQRIREFFKPLEHHRRTIAALVQEARKDCKLLIGVHLRQGDYKEFLSGKYFYEIEDYRKVIEQVVRLFPNTELTFLICSNVCHDFPSFVNGRIIYGTGQMIEDLYALAECDYIIGPPSTFSLWASFCGDVPLYFIEDVNAEITLADFKKGLQR